MNRTRTIALFNALVIFLTIFWNYYANTGVISENTVGSLSDKYNSFLTPAGYTFAIWGIIFLGLIYLAIYCLRQAFQTKDEVEQINKGIPWVILANLFNSTWLYFWLTEQVGISVILLFLITFSLMMAVIKLKMDIWDAPNHVIFGLWGPIEIYFGWVTVATIVNLSVYLKYVEWQGLGLSEIQWTIIMIVVAAALNMFMILKRNLRGFGLVGVWALMGIAARYWSLSADVKWTALSCAVILLVTINIHAYRNRKTLPFLRKKYE